MKHQHRNGLPGPLPYAKVDVSWWIQSRRLQLEPPKFPLLSLPEESNYNTENRCVRLWSKKRATELQADKSPELVRPSKHRSIPNGLIKNRRQMNFHPCSLFLKKLLDKNVEKYNWL